MFVSKSCSIVYSGLVALEQQRPGIGELSTQYVKPVTGTCFIFSSQILDSRPDKLLRERLRINALATRALADVASVDIAGRRNHANVLHSIAIDMIDQERISFELNDVL